MQGLTSLFHRYLDEVDRHRQKYEDLAIAAKNNGDREAYNKIRVQLGMLDMSEALFIKSYSGEYGLLPRRERRQRKPMPPAWPEEREVCDEERKLGKLIRYGKLVRIPKSYKKKLMVMDLLAKRFESKRDYNESEVNDLISQIHPDYCTWRRWLVDAGYLQRQQGIYRAV